MNVGSARLLLVRSHFAQANQSSDFARTFPPVACQAWIKTGQADRVGTHGAPGWPVLVLCTQRQPQQLAWPGPHSHSHSHSPLPRHATPRLATPFHRVPALSLSRSLLLPPRRPIRCADKTSNCVSSRVSRPSGLPFCLSPYGAAAGWPTSPSFSAFLTVSRRRAGPPLLPYGLPCLAAAEDVRADQKKGATLSRPHGSAVVQATAAAGKQGGGRRTADGGLWLGRLAGIRTRTPCVCVCV